MSISPRFRRFSVLQLISGGPRLDSNRRSLDCKSVPVILLASKLQETVCGSALIWHVPVTRVQAEVENCGPAESILTISFPGHAVVEWRRETWSLKFGVPTVQGHDHARFQTLRMRPFEAGTAQISPSTTSGQQFLQKGRKLCRPPATRAAGHRHHPEPRRADLQPWSQLFSLKHSGLLLMLLSPFTRVGLVTLFQRRERGWQWGSSADYGEEVGKFGVSVHGPGIELPCEPQRPAKSSGQSRRTARREPGHWRSGWACKTDASITKRYVGGLELQVGTNRRRAIGPCPSGRLPLVVGAYGPPSH